MPVNPALAAFEEQIPDQLVWGQVLITRCEAGFELRHEADRTARPDDLRVIEISALRALAGVNAAGEFRPLKSQPDLPAGWRAFCRGVEELGCAFQHLYPGSIADWFALRQAPSPPVTNYREYTGRQTGMYRITQMLSDEQAGRVIRAGCYARNCVKRRFWTVDGLEADAAETKSLIPCLEPCAILLEFARKSMRTEQEENAPLQMKESEWETALAAVDQVLSKAAGIAPVGSFNAPLNPRRMQLILEKYRKPVELARKKPPQE